MWTVATTDVFDEWFRALGDEERAEIEASRAAILLVGGDKRGRSQRPFYRQLIAKADMLYAEYLDRLKTTGKKRGGK